MEIVHLVLGKANPNRMNGVNKVVYELASRQTLAGQNVSVWGITKNIATDDSQRPFKLILFKAYRNLYRLDSKLVNAFKAKKEDIVVHIHGSWIPTFFSVSKVLKKLKIAYIVFPHGGYNSVALEKSNWAKKIYFSFYEKRFLRGAASIHCIGESEVDGLRKLGIENKTVLLPYGFQAEKKKLEIKKNKVFTFCYMGRIDSYTKGLDLLFDAFKKLLEKGYQAELFVIGEGEDLEKWMQYSVATGISEEITFFGAKFGEEKFHLMSQTHVFLHPSRNEGLPSAIFEAASVSLPVIVSKATNFGHAVKRNNCGWVIENANKKALFQAMKESVMDENLPEKGENALAMLEKDFHWDNILKQYYQMYLDAFKK